jgi:hypothetical protein
MVFVNVAFHNSVTAVFFVVVEKLLNDWFSFNPYFKSIVSQRGVSLHMH